MSGDVPHSAMEAMERNRRPPRPDKPTPSPNGVKEEHELTDGEREGIFTMYCKPHLWTMEDIRKRWLVTEHTAHYVYDIVEAMVRSVRRRPPKSKPKGGRPDGVCLACGMTIPAGKMPPE